jgi:phage terminase large subunit
MASLDIPTAAVFEPLLAASRYKGAHGGRGSGKSHFFADLMIEENIREKLDNVCLRETLKSLEFSVKKLLESKIEAFNVGAHFEVQDRRILTKRGGTIIFEGMQNHTADSIKSLEGFDRAWFEEAQNASEKSLTLLRPTIRKNASEMWFSWNPNHATDPIDKLLRGGNQPRDAIVVQANYMDNPWISPELLEEMELDRRTDMDKFRHVWLGEYQTISEAQVLRGKYIVDEFTPAMDWDGPYYGADWGFSVDPSTLVKLWIGGRTLYVEHEAWGIGVDNDALPSLFDRVPGSRQHTIRADNARPETISHMTKKGFNVVACIKGKGSVEDGIAQLRGFDQIVIHPRCTHAINEANHWRYKQDRLTGDVLPELIDGNDHIWDASRYALEPLLGGRGLTKPKPYTPPQVEGGWMR